MSKYFLELGYFFFNYLVILIDNADYRADDQPLYVTYLLRQKQILWANKCSKFMKKDKMHSLYVCNFDLTTQKNLCKNIHFSTEDC